MTQRDLTFTLYNPSHSGHVSIAPTENRQTRPWGKWLELFFKHDIRSEKHGPLVVLGGMKTNPEDPSQLLARGNANLESAHAMGFDFDDGFAFEEVEVLHEALAAHPHIFHTTHKSKGFDRWRLIVPLARPIVRVDWKHYYRRFAQYLGVEKDVDKATKDFARMYYLPSTPDPKEAKTLAVVEGPFFDLDSLPPLEMSLTASDPRSELPELDDDDLKKLRAFLFGLTASIKNPEVIKAVAREQPIPLGEIGGRHNAVRHFTWILARSRKANQINPARIVQLLRPSFDQMDQSDFDLEQEVESCWEGALQKIDADVKERTGAATSDPFTPEQLQFIADQQGVEVGDLAKRWILKDARGTVWVLNEKGDYIQRHEKTVTPELESILPRAGIATHKITQSGVSAFTVEELYRRHGSAVEEVIYDAMVTVSRYDPAEPPTLRRPVYPIRAELKPQRSEAVEEWLKLLGGKSYDLILDWLACAPDPSKPLCALYLCGGMQVGKTVFGQGVARLWKEDGSAVPAEAMFGFNEEFLKTPLLFADEGIPKDPKIEAVTALRNILGSPVQKLSKKYKDRADLIFWPRVILAANNPDVLRSRSRLTGKDIEAIADRFAFVECQSAAAGYLKDLDPETHSLLSEGNALAEHALFLQQTRKVERKGRYYVIGGQSEMTRQLIQGNDNSSLVVEWITHFVLNPTKYHQTHHNAAKIVDGEVLVNAHAITDRLELYLPHMAKQTISTRDVSTAVASLSEKTDDGEPRRRQHRGKKYYVIDPIFLENWANMTNLASPEELRERLQYPSLEVVSR